MKILKRYYKNICQIFNDYFIANCKLLLSRTPQTTLIAQH